MYANPATVIGLCTNVRSLTDPGDPRILAAADVVDPKIDATLSEVFDWPNDQNGNPVNPIPPIIVAIASLLVAARIESAAYAQNEAGNTFNPYAASLRKEGETMLTKLQASDGSLLGVGLYEDPPLVVVRARRAFSPVSGFGYGTRFSRLLERDEPS